jgi:AraC-like DNA-binding protein
MVRSSSVQAVTVSVQGVWLLAAGAGARGLDVPQLLAQHGLSDALGADVDARVPAQAVLALWSELPRLTGLPHFGLWLAELACAGPPSSLGARLVHSAPTLRAGFARLVRFETVFHGVRATVLSEQDGVARFTHTPPIGVGPGAQPAIEFAFAWLLGTARFTTATKLEPRAVSFTHPAPVLLDEYRRVFGVEPRFDATENALDLPGSALDLPQSTADALIARLVERHASELSRRLPEGPEPVASVRSLIARSLGIGDIDSASLGSIAAQLQLSERTLQRRLAAAGSSFAVLLDDVRCQLSLEHLAEPQTSVAEVAFALGFADQTAFHRAFVRWTGRTPGEHRKRLAARAKPS